VQEWGWIVFVRTGIGVTRKLLQSLQVTCCNGLIVPFLILAVWESASRLHMITTMFLPAPSVVFQAGCDLLIQRGVLIHIWSSISLILRGFVIGTIFGFLAGAACGVVLTAELLFSPLLNALRQVPTIAWLPVIAFAVGHEDLGKLTIIALTVFFPVFIHTLQGISHVSSELLEVARIYGFSRRQLFRRVLLPAALPTMFTGIRFGAGMSWALIVVVEMFSGRMGIGYLLDRRQELLFVDETIVLLVVIGLLGFSTDYFLITIEKRMTRWNQHSGSSNPYTHCF
jgi:sulfonate transport system permease protein